MDRLRRVGEVAPDFQAVVFHRGASSEIHLSQYRGKWVILLFYIGDFTIV
jgi:peroxiredoxin (alkyl hydroperoxide reductase subunit C)